METTSVADKSAASFILFIIKRITIIDGGSVSL
jgi:hypothetical protein